MQCVKHRFMNSFTGGLTIAPPMVIRRHRLGRSVEKWLRSLCSSAWTASGGRWVVLRASVVWNSAYILFQIAGVPPKLVGRTIANSSMRRVLSPVANPVRPPMRKMAMMASRSDAHASDRYEKKTFSLLVGKHQWGKFARKALSDIIAPLGKPELPLV